MNTTILRASNAWLLGLLFIAAGANHFRVPAAYLPIMPPWLPYPRALIAISGAAEILGGIGLLVPATRRIAGLGLIALLIAVFPANLHMALHRIQLGGLELPTAALWLRLPLQGLLIWWVWWASRRPPPRRQEDH